MALPKIIKAGGGECGQYIMRAFNDNTVRFVLNYPGIVDVDILHAATKAIVESVDVLHGTFFTEGIGAHWMLNENADESNYFLFVETDGDPVVTANSLSLLPVYAEGKVQIHCTLVQSEAASHAAMGASVDLIPGIVVAVCTIGAVGSAKFTNQVDEKMLKRAAGIVLLLVRVVSWVLRA